MPVELTARTPPPRGEFRVTGRFVAVCVVAFFAVIAAVNGVMMTLAITTFSGVDAKNGYEVSQAYNKEIAAARAQHERGWVVGQMVERREGAAIIGLNMRDKGGAPVSGLAMEAQFKHPSDKKLDRSVALDETGPGAYSAKADGIAAGAWNLHVVGMRGAETAYVSDNRIILR